MDLKGRDFLKLLDFTTEEIAYLLDLAADLKEKKKKGIPVDTLRGKNVALIFEKTSTRTRCAFEVAAHDLGMGTGSFGLPDRQEGEHRGHGQGPGGHVRGNRIPGIRAGYRGGAGEVCQCACVERAYQ